MLTRVSSLLLRASGHEKLSLRGAALLASSVCSFTASTSRAQCCETAYRLVCQTVYENRQVTCYHNECETVYEPQEISRQVPVWETQARERRFKVLRPVTETSMREERFTVMKPVCETVMRDASYNVVRNITETAEREERYLVSRPYGKPPSAKNATSFSGPSAKRFSSSAAAP